MKCLLSLTLPTLLAAALWTTSAVPAAETRSSAPTGGSSESDEVITQIIPIRYADASHLAKNLQPLLSPLNSFSVNESAILIDQLDSSPAGREVVRAYELRGADPQDVSPMLQALFNRTTASQSSSANRNSFPGDNNPLVTRQTSRKSSASSGSSGTAPSSGSTGTGRN